MQDKERLKYDRTESTHLVSTSKDKGKKRKKACETAPMGPTQKKQQQDNKGCFFCNKTGHVKKDYAKYHAWHAKKGTILTLVCSEVNLASIPRNTWWLDSSATTHISVSM